MTNSIANTPAIQGRSNTIDTIRKYCDDAGMPEDSPLRAALLSINETASTLRTTVDNMSRLPEKALMDRVGSEARHIFNIYAEQTVRHFYYRTLLYAGMALVGAMLLGAGVDRLMVDDGLVEHACLTQGDVRVDAKSNRYCLIALPSQTPPQTR